MEDNRRDPTGDTGQAADEGRREALLKIGKYGAYVAPAVLAIVLGKDANAVLCGSLC